MERLKLRTETPAWNAVLVQEIVLPMHSGFVQAWAVPPLSSIPCWAGKNPPAAAASIPKIKDRIDKIALAGGLKIIRRQNVEMEIPGL